MLLVLLAIGAAAYLITYYAQQASETASERQADYSKKQSASLDISEGSGSDTVSGDDIVSDDGVVGNPKSYPKSGGWMLNESPGLSSDVKWF